MAQGEELTPVHVRPLAMADLDAVTQMICGLSAHHGDPPRVTAETLARDALGGDPWIRVLVAEIDAEVAGYAALTRICWLHYGDRGMELYHLFIRPDWRRRGVGRILIAAAKEAARAAGCVELKVGTHPDNIAAQGYYLAQGFERQALVGARFRFYL